MQETEERRKEDKIMMKEAWREAMKEWLDEKYTQVGRWSVRIILTAIGGIVLYFVLTINGWHK